MLFNSYPFVFVFPPITLAGFFILGRGSMVGLASVFSYALGSRRCGLLLASIIFNYGITYGIARALHLLDTTAQAHHRKLLLIPAVGANLGLPADYKYPGFFRGH